MQLPRFQLDSYYMLRDTLRNLEISKVFESGAEINDLGVGGVKLDQVTSWRPPPGETSLVVLLAEP